jgi:anti-anti-sigma regulatory factor
MSEIIKFGNLSIHIENEGQTATYTFSGEVDENFRQKDVPRIKASKIILNLENLSHFNSCGIREWVYLIRDFAKLGTLTFRQCSVAMVDQINMVPDSITGGTVESFYAPYACDEHGEMAKLIKMNEINPAMVLSNPPAMNCDHCKRELEFDAIPSSYFLFCAAAPISKAS